jgi:hypothetical protein
VRLVALSVITMMLGAGIFFLLTGPNSSLVFAPESSTSEQPPTPTPQPSEPTPTPMLTPTPDPRERYRELEQTFFPILSQLRQIPGNEDARVDWELRGPLSGNEITTPSGQRRTIIYVVYGIAKIPVDMLLPNIRDPRYRPEAGVYLQRGWEFVAGSLAYGAFLPDGRTGFSCDQKGSLLSPCRLQDDTFIVEEPARGILFKFTVYDKGEFGYVVPEWDGPLPPTQGGGR